MLVGRSNVGKSSIIRQLTGKKVVIGRRPGVTRRITRYNLGKMEIVDMPGFGFMSGVPKFLQEKIKTEIVRYLEGNRKRIIFALEILDARSFSEIAERWQRRGQIPVDAEMFSFLGELNLNPLVVANKIDLIPRAYRDAVLDDICEKLGLPPPWRQWTDIFVPLSAKTGEGIPELKNLIKQRMHAAGLGRYIGWLK
ncbi:MAG: GTP-binding protein EngB [Candidatus Hadarchaeum sp.]|uniref:GTP-binding protein EngB n=1 Tax=Candidatus Hadarchaeum sp. TaxID=2883567 RepID=UPI003D0AFB00